MGRAAHSFRIRETIISRTLLILTALLTPAAVQAQAAPSAAPIPAAAPRKPVMAVTHHTVTINGQAVSYTATVAEHFLRDENGAPAAAVITIAYTRDGVKDARRRPVLFAFNGGPGASSSPLHMNALGPIRRVGEVPGDRASGHLANNPYSPLDVADLVFIDPVGTGFSRAFAGADAKRWYSITGDAKAVKSVVAEWLEQNHREASPKYLVGESYGTVRAPMMLNVGPPMPFDGVLLIALVGSAPGHEMPYVTSLPTMAAGAWFHNRIDRAGRGVAEVYREAVEFARTEYVSALIKGSSLPDTERRRIAERMSKLIGLPVDLILAKNLRITQNDYMFNLLKDKGLRTGLLDVRVTAPLEPGQQGAIDDPALGVAPKRPANVPAGPPPTPESIGAVPSPQVGRYITEVLKFPTTETYYGVNFTVNAKWNYENHPDAIRSLADAMKANRKLRLFWAAGYYDLTTPAYEARYTLDHDGIPPDRLTAVYFAGPHGVYSGEDNLAAFDAAVRKFVGPPAER